MPPVRIGHARFGEKPMLTPRQLKEAFNADRVFDPEEETEPEEETQLEALATIWILAGEILALRKD